MNMDRRFNLIKSDFEKHEKRVLPRFPFCYLTFKADDTARVYEIKDISLTGMQLALKDGNHEFSEDVPLKGHIHWLGQHLDIAGTVKWVTGTRMGVEFHKKRDILDRVKTFLDLSEIAKRLKPLHRVDEGLEIPARLKYWVRCDGPVELFVWQHNDGEIAKFQALYLDDFVEWEDGQGVKSGKIVSKRNVDSPLINEDEWLFKLDLSLDERRLSTIKDFIHHIPANMLPDECRSFLSRQLS